MQIPAVKAQVRAEIGTKAMRRARAAGQMPGVLYGKGRDNVNLLFASRDIEDLVKSEEHVVQLDVNGQSEYALMRALQHDHMGDAIRHIDFVRVDLGDKVRVLIPLSFLGTPKGATHGGLLEVSHGEVEVKCPVDRIPKHIEVEVTNLELDESVTLKDLKLPEGAEPLLKADTIIVKCSQARRADLEEAAAAAAAAPGAAAAADAAAAAAVPSAKGAPKPAEAEVKGKESKEGKEGKK